MLFSKRDIHPLSEGNTFTETVCRKTEDPTFPSSALAFFFFILLLDNGRLRFGPLPSPAGKAGNAIQPHGGDPVSGSNRPNNDVLPLLIPDPRPSSYRLLQKRVLASLLRRTAFNSQPSLTNTGDLLAFTVRIHLPGEDKSLAVQEYLPPYQAIPGQPFYYPKNHYCFFIHLILSLSNITLLLRIVAHPVLSFFQLHLSRYGMIYSEK